MRPLVFAVASFIVSLAFQMTMAKYGAKVPDAALLALWILPLAPFGWWLWTHDKLLTRREKIKQYFRLHLWRSIGVATATLLIVAACLWGVGYTGWRMLKNVTQSASIHEKVTISDTPQAQKPPQSSDATRALGTPPSEAPIDLAGAMEKIEARKLHIKEDTTAKDSMREVPEKPRPLQTPPMGNIDQGAGSALSINQQGGITAGTINVGPPPPPPLKLTMSVSEQNGDEKFKYQKVVTITTNVTLSPVAIGIVCDAPVEYVEMGTHHGGAFLNERTGMEGNAAFVYYEGTPLISHDELYVTLKSSKPFSVLEVRPATIKGVND